MIALVQRVNRARVTIEGKIISESGKGLLVFAGVERGDSEADVLYTSRKIINLRCFEDDQGKMNRNVKDINGEIMAVSQFTLAADTKRGNRPGFNHAEEPGRARLIFENLVKFLSSEGVRVCTGEFGAHMHIELENDGPVTFIIDSRRRI